jgi:hypothetical protein
LPAKPGDVQRAASEEHLKDSLSLPFVPAAF